MDSTWNQTKMEVQKGGSSQVYRLTRFCFSIMLLSITVIFKVQSLAVIVCLYLSCGAVIILLLDGYLRGHQNR